MRDGVATLRAQMSQVLDVSASNARALQEHDRRLMSNESEWRNVREDLKTMRVEMVGLRAELTAVRRDMEEIGKQRAAMIGGVRVLGAALGLLGMLVGWGIAIWTK